MNHNADNESLTARATEILHEHQRRIYRRTDRMFAVLLVVQWVATIVAALAISPRTWNGANSQLHPHVALAVVFGGTICALPVFLAWRYPAQTLTRYTISVAQVLFSSLMIHVSGGRIETHFHIFASLALLTAYRDWTVLIPATVVVAVDHLVRGFWWPESVFGVLTASPWRTLEHAAWVVFEDFFLIVTIRQSVDEMRAMSLQTARLEQSHDAATEYSDQLTASSLKERAIIEGALDAVVQIDGDGVIQSWNTQAERTFGWTADEAIGRLLPELVVPEHCRDLYEAERRLVVASQGADLLNQRREVEGLHKSGRVFAMEIAVTPIRSGANAMFCAFIRDITARKQYEEELRLAKEQAETANRTKSEFLANMSHEIRTPLNGILGFTELLIRNADGGDEAERRDYIKTIRTSGKHLLELINDILDLSKIEAGQLQVEKTACSPHHLIAEVMSVLRARAQEKALTLDYRWDSEIPESIQSDPYRVRQLLMNLVGNAVKFTERGSVNVVARLVRGKSDADARLILEVRDTGIGISKEHLEDIFKPFVQADNSMTRKFGGTGLGLTISKNICDSLGGKLSVASQLGKGTTFTAEIPAGDLRGVRMGERPPATGQGDIVDSREGKANLNGVRVLLVDDGETNRKLIQLFLARQGALVEVAENGELAVAATLNNEFDVILMDMQMPVMDGYAATRKLRDLGYTIPIVALTAHAMLGDRKKCEEAGCTGYVTKPVNMDELVRIVQVSARGNAAAPSSPAELLASADGDPAADAIRSTLPCEDPEIRELVAEFASTIPDRIDSIERALETMDYATVASLAHALKGAGGTAGFQCLTEVSTRLEESAAQQHADSIGGMLHELRTLHQRIVV